MHDVSDKELILTCQWCSKKARVTYKTRQPKFCSEACKQKYKRHEQKRQQKKAAVAEQIIEQVIQDWIRAGLSPVVYDLIEIAVRDGVDTALSAADIASKAVKHTVQNGKTNSVTSQEINRLAAEARGYIINNLNSS